MKSKQSIELKKKLAEKHNLSQGAISDIVESPMRLLYVIMKDLSSYNDMVFPSLRIPKFGIFKVPHWKLRRITKRKLKKKV